MAGRPQSSGKMKELQSECDALREDNTRLRALIVSLDPSLLERKEGPEPFGPVSEQNQEELNRRILVMADEGLMENEWIATLGMTQEEWDEVVIGFPLVRHAVSRARVKVKARLESITRRALEGKDNRFASGAMQQLHTLITASTERQKGSSGDGSSLVRIAS